jgi:hypothetical protein
MQNRTVSIGLDIPGDFTIFEFGLFRTFGRDGVGSCITLVVTYDDLDLGEYVIVGVS